MNRIPFSDVQATLAGVLRKLGFADDRADTCARLFAETTRDGVHTHGINRFARFVVTIRNGRVIPDAEPEVTAQLGALERWDGHRGPGNLAALAAMERAIILGREHGVGCVALGNTNHWMRGGTFGWQAAEVDGHSVAALTAAMSPGGDAPKIILARTIFGKGVSYMEQGIPLSQTHLSVQPVNWHYLPMSDHEFAVAMEEIERAS